MRFITDMMISGQTIDHFVTFAQLLNEMRLIASIKEPTRKFIFSTDIISQSIVNWLEGSEREQSDDDDEPHVMEMLYKQLSELFERFSNSSTMKQLSIAENQDRCFEYTCKALEMLLKCSEKAQKMASDDRFVLSIVEQMEKVLSSVGGSLIEFVRKCGNAKVRLNNNQFRIRYEKCLSLIMDVIYTFDFYCLKRSKNMLKN